MDECKPLDDGSGGGGGSSDSDSGGSLDSGDLETHGRGCVEQNDSNQIGACLIFRVSTHTYLPTFPSI
jgi:hypothetical protein